MVVGSLIYYNAFILDTGFLSASLVNPTVKFTIHIFLFYFFPICWLSGPHGKINLFKRRLSWEKQNMQCGMEISLGMSGSYELHLVQVPVTYALLTKCTLPSPFHLLWQIIEFKCCFVIPVQKVIKIINLGQFNSDLSHCKNRYYSVIWYNSSVK